VADRRAHTMGVGMGIGLAGRHALVTGGTRGIGRAVTLALAGAGAEVMACYRSGGDHAERLAWRLKELGGDHHVVQADVADPKDVARLGDECRDRFGSLDVVVNNAGVISHIPIMELELSEWRRVLDTNLTGAFLVIQKVLPMLEVGASIVNVGSRASSSGVPLRAHYTAAKAGLVGLTRSLAKELGPHGIRVNVVAPGVIDSDLERRLAPGQRAELARRYSALTALGRVGEVEEVAGAVLFLSSDLARFVTGQTIDVDGGI
jgi:3-oxoacyl-[acyl-carrier protein] reductase